LDVPPVAEPPVYRYTIEVMPPSRLGRRWRWTLFSGDRLLAAGWRLSERRAVQGLRTAAARAAHEALGLKVLRPDRTWSDSPFLPGTTVRLESGPVACVLAPRGAPAAAA
jgi:hypothetical protein